MSVEAKKLNIFSIWIYRQFGKSFFVSVTDYKYMDES